jgi:gamma-glutamyl hercynylcysteine S-oxide synthase
VQRTLYSVLFLVLCPCSLVHPQDVVNWPKGEEIPGPRCQQPSEWNTAKASTCQPEEITAWLKDVEHWRNERRIRIGFDPTDYENPELKWTQSSFIQPQMMVHDRFFYDPVSRSYKVNTYLDDLKARYGGIDSVLIWHTYPNIGIDDRNQFDMFRDLPGGTDGVRRMVEDFHRNHVKVFFPVMLWDQGTRQEATPEWEALAKELAAVGADGVNGDTLEGIPRVFKTAAEALHHPIALEPEVAFGSDEMINYDTMSWGYWDYGFVPSISRYKWLETRHMVNISNRYAHNHLDDFQFAFFNGIGFESWENIWGEWNQLTPRDAEALRRIATIERAYSDLLVSPGWEPHTKTVNFGVFASKWPLAQRTLWTLVNRNPYEVTGGQLRVPIERDVHYFDIWHGQEIIPVVEGNEATLSFDIEANGYGAILKTAELKPSDRNVLGARKTLSERPLSSFSSEWKMLPQSLVKIPATVPPHGSPEGMVRIPEGDFVFRVNGIEIEGSDGDGVDVQYPEETSPRRYHSMPLHLTSFWIDRYNVTNEEFKRFLDATHYAPADAHNFLKDWKDGSFPEGWAKKPVTWVSIEDARAYASWAGKRLPHEWEWQYAAQGTDGRRYPWGTCNWVTPPGLHDGRLCPWGADPMATPAPLPDKGRQMLPASDVDAHPNGASPFGVMDLVGNVWQWTDEYVDLHTRAAILRGGSHYQPQGSRWYFPQAYLLSEHGKYLLMAPSLDRSGTIGFRCVKDAQ